MNTQDLQQVSWKKVAEDRYNLMAPSSEEVVAEIKLGKIGSIDNGIDGKDEYVLMTRLDDDLSPENAHRWFLPVVYSECTHPGGYFCTSIQVVQAQYSPNKVIITVLHRYDV